MGAKKISYVSAVGKCHCGKNDGNGLEVHGYDACSTEIDEETDGWGATLIAWTALILTLIGIGVVMGMWIK